MRSFSSKVASLLLTLVVTAWPCQAQTVGDETSEPVVMKGFLIQTGITPESYLVTNAEQLKAFVGTLSPTLPTKIMPAPANPDPLLKDFEIDFRYDVLVVAVGRNRITDPPRYEGTDEMPDGSRRVRFAHPPPTSAAYPFGWGVYSAVVLPRIQGRTSVVVRTPKKKRTLTD